MNSPSFVIARLLNSPEEFSNFGLTVVEYVERERTETSKRKLPFVLLSTSETEAFVVRNEEIHSVPCPTLYRIHSDKDFYSFEKFPQILQQELPEGVYVCQMCSGKSHTLLLDSQGSVHSFGCGSRGELGIHKNNVMKHQLRLARP